MPLSPGSPLGPYQVLSLLGAGGMGEVYRARDPRLGREVAIKVLPGNLSMDAERMRRFELEAKAVGALSHPNLLAVFDTGQHEGAPFVVFELLDGATLRVRLGGKPLATTQALDYATQIARGLPAAHEKGIVHRDLKPENLFVTRDGRVKILDFGLAKLRPPLDPGAVAADTPTASAMTEAGTILGTVGYMSPEQVRRSQVDHRSDIFSFGAVLYEMLSGRRAFQRETDAEVMTAILKAGPAALAEANPTVPRGLERIVKHCLEKRPEDRFQTARDLVFALESVAAGSGGVAVNGVSAARRRWLLPVVSAGLLGLAIGLGSAFLRQPWGPRSLAFNQVTFRRGMIAEARFAPDGQTVVYGAAVEGHHNRLFSARLGSAEVRALDLPEGDIGGINRSGEMAILLARSYVGRHGILALASLAGGAVRERLEDVSAADWGPDGTTLAVIRQEKTRNRIEFPIGNVLYESPNGISALRVSRTGDRIAFLEGEEPDHGLLRVVDLARKVTTLTSTDGSYGLAWSPKGSEVWFSEWGILRAVTLSGGKRVLTRFPGPITINDVTDDGRVLVTTAQWYQHLMFAGPADTKERDLGWFEGASSAALSHDGKTLLFHDRGRGTGSPDPPNVYLRRTDGSPAVRLGEGIPMALSPDGKWAMTRPSGRPWHCVLVPTGPGESRPLPTDDLECACASWFPDGKRVVVTGVSAGKTWRVYIQDVQGGTRRPLTPEGFSLGFPAYEPSPDGKQVLASTTDGPGRHVVFPVDGGQPKPVTGLGPREVSAGWSADSQSLYVYAVEADLPVTIDKLDLGSGRRERFKTLSPADMSAFAGIFNGRVTPDGRAYAYTSGQYPCILYVIEGLR